MLTCDKKDPSENAQHIKSDHARAQEYLVTANALEVFYHRHDLDLHSNTDLNSASSKNYTIEVLAAFLSFPLHTNRLKSTPFLYIPNFLNN